MASESEVRKYIFFWLVQRGSEECGVGSEEAGSFFIPL